MNEPITEQAPGTLRRFLCAPPARFMRDVQEDCSFIDGMSNVSVVGKAIVERSGITAIGRNLYCDQASVKWADGGHVTFHCEGVSVDDFADQGNPHPTVLKIDVEGAEVEVLLGSTVVLSQTKPIIVLETHGAEPATKVYNLLTDHGYLLYNIEADLAPIHSASSMPHGMSEGHVMAVHPNGVKPLKPVMERINVI